MDINEWIACSVKQNASDLHLCSGHPPIWRVDGEVRRVPGWPCCVSEQLDAWCKTWMSTAQRQQLLAEGQVDGALTIMEAQRLRVQVFRQRLGLSAALRFIPPVPRPLEALHAPPILISLLAQRAGLILVTGATGSGKSTTLAAMVGALLQRRPCHVITLEDPIEYIYPPQAGLIQQREIGLHSASFSHALRAALRQDPDVILLGELRDGETIRLALTAAETGHLVLATLHARGATQAIERLLDVFSAQEKDFVRSQLALCLQAVVAQHLIPQRGGGRIALFEVLLATSAVANLIREGKTHQLPGLLQMGGKSGMQTFQQSWQQRCQEGLLSTEDAHEYLPFSQDKGEIKR